MGKTHLSDHDLARFALDLSCLLRAGIPLVDAYATLADRQGAAAGFAGDLRRALLRGQSSAAVFTDWGMPALFVRFFETGVESGQLAWMMQKLSERYSEQARERKQVRARRIVCLVSAASALLAAYALYRTRP